jgi:hypothetical protein
MCHIAYCIGGVSNLHLYLNIYKYNYIISGEQFKGEGLLLIKNVKIEGVLECEKVFRYVFLFSRCIFMRF